MNAKLLPSETVLPDDYPVYPGYVYIVDGVFCRLEDGTIETVASWKRVGSVQEVRRCDLFGHDGVCLGDRVEL